MNGIVYSPHYLFSMKMILFTVLYQPIFNVFVFLYSTVGDIGVAIILMTILVKLVLYPFTIAGIRAQKSLTDMQPKMDAIRAAHKGNQQKIAEETMKLYKEHKVNPFGSCLPLLVQVAISIALYYVLRDGLTSDNFSALYSFVPNPGHINPVSFGLFDLSKGGNYVLALLAGAAQFWQAKMMMRKRPPKGAGAEAKDEDLAAIMNKQMLYVMPVLTVVIGSRLPAGLALYWFVSTLLTALQQLIVFRKSPPPDSSPGSGSGSDKAAPVIEGKIVE